MSEAVKTDTYEMIQAVPQTSVSVLLQVVRWSFACLLAGVLIFIANSSGRLAATETTTKTTTPTSMQIEWLQDLKFGTFVRTAAGGTVTIAPTGERTVGTGVFVLPGADNLWTQAQFRITKPTGGGDNDDSDDGDDDDNGDSDDRDDHQSESDDHDDDYNASNCSNTGHKKGGANSIADLGLFGFSDTDDDDDRGGINDGDDDDGESTDHCNILVTLPTSSTTLRLYNQAGEYMTVSEFKPVLAPDGQTLNVGAKLNIQQNQPRGLYQGKFYVTAICE
jgi:hypothetical protein